MTKFESIFYSGRRCYGRRKTFESFTDGKNWGSLSCILKYIINFEVIKLYFIIYSNYNWPQNLDFVIIFSEKVIKYIVFLFNIFIEETVSNGLYIFFIKTEIVK